MYLILSGMSLGYNSDNIGYSLTMVQTYIIAIFAINII